MLVSSPVNDAINGRDTKKLAEILKLSMKTTLIRRANQNSLRTTCTQIIGELILNHH